MSYIFNIYIKVLFPYSIVWDHLYNTTITFQQKTSPNTSLYIIFCTTNLSRIISSWKINSIIIISIIDVMFTIELRFKSLSQQLDKKYISSISLRISVWFRPANFSLLYGYFALLMEYLYFILSDVKTILSRRIKQY